MKYRIVALAGVIAGVSAWAHAAPPAPAMAAGEKIFAANCAACHQPTGLGIPGAFPALAKNVFLTGAPDLVVQTLLNGRGGMPSFRDGLDDAGIAAVLTYARASWGNKAPAIAPALVAKNRAGKAVAVERPIPAH